MEKGLRSDRVLWLAVVTRPAFILSKVIANCLGVLATMVVLPGGIAYILFWIGQRPHWIRSNS